MALHKWQGHKDDTMTLLTSLPNAHLMYMSKDEEVVLLQETEKGNLLLGASSHQMLDAVSDEGRELFESRLKSRRRTD